MDKILCADASFRFGSRESCRGDYGGKSRSVSHVLELGLLDEQ